MVAAAKFLVAATKKLFVDPNFVAVTKPIFPVNKNSSEKKHLAFVLRRSLRLFLQFERLLARRETRFQSSGYETFILLVKS